MNADDKKLLLNAGLVVGGYFLVLKPVLQKLGLQKDPDVVATETRNAALVNNWIVNNTTVQAQTKTDTEWKIIADQIYEDLKYSFLNDNKDDAAYQVCRVKNDTDFSVLFKFFGKRQTYVFPPIPDGGLKNLVQVVISNLSKEKIAEINGNYSRKGIKFRF